MEFNRTDIINSFKPKSYLEIGVQDKTVNFDKIKAHYKVGVDPDERAGVLPITSDEFFKQNTEKFDVIFIDGLHENMQVRCDIRNSLKCLNKRGTIVIHDCNPIEEVWQIVPRESGMWTGDVWKAFVYFRRRKDLKMYVIDRDYGCGIIQKGEQEPLYVPEEDLTWVNLEQNREKWLNLMTFEAFYDIIKATN